MESALIIKEVSSCSFKYPTPLRLLESLGITVIVHAKWRVVAVE